MSVATVGKACRRASLVALCLLAPGAGALAQEGRITLPSVTEPLGSAPNRMAEWVAPSPLRLGLAPDAGSAKLDLPWPQRPSVTRPSPLWIRALTAAAMAPGDSSTVTCPMPVARLDTSAVPAMPRMDAPVGDRGGVTVPSCRNPLDAR